MKKSQTCIVAVALFCLVSCNGIGRERPAIFNFVDSDNWTEFKAHLSKEDQERLCNSDRGVLQYSLKHGKYRYAEAMLDFGCSIDAKDYGTVLYWTTLTGDKEKVQWLIEHGANPLLGTESESPAEAAKRLGYDDIAKLLENS